MRYLNHRRNGFIASAAVILVVALACERAATSGPDRDASQRATSPASVPIASGATAAPGDPRLRDMWVGQVHSEMMTDWVNNRATWIGKKRDAKTVCRALAKLMVRGYVRAEKKAGMPARKEVEREMSAWNGLSHTVKPCQSVARAELFKFGPGARQEETPGFQPYLDMLTNQVQQTDGSPAAVASVGSAVLSAASGLSPEDYYAVLGAVDLVNSSSTYWTAAVESNPDAYCWDIEQTCKPLAETTLFAPRIGWPHILAVVIGDEIGCIAGELSAWHGGRGGDEKYMYTECAIWGGGASAAAVLSFLKI